jgi:hypothetical protein
MNGLRAMLNYQLFAGVLTFFLLSSLSCLIDVGSAVAADLPLAPASGRRGDPKPVAATKLLAQSNRSAFQSSNSEASQRLGTLTKLASNTDASPQPSAATPTAKTTDLVNALRKTKLVDPAYKLGATASGDQIVITTERNPKSTDNECKIEAVLIAKAMFETVSSDFQRTKVLLFDYANNKCSEVTVKRAEVKLFGSGGLSEKELLSSLELNTTDAADQNLVDAVAPGPMQAGRISLLSRIQRLKSRGTDTTPFQKMFDALEESAKSNDIAAVHSQYDELKRVLNEESDMIKSAKSAHLRRHKPSN